jgi:hypothetical protein
MPLMVRQAHHEVQAVDIARPHPELVYPLRAVFSRCALRPVVCQSGNDGRHGASLASTGPFQNYRKVNYLAVATAEFRRAVIMLNFGLAAVVNGPNLPQNG